MVGRVVAGRASSRPTKKQAVKDKTIESIEKRILSYRLNGQDFLLGRALVELAEVAIRSNNSKARGDELARFIAGEVYPGLQQPAEMFDGIIYGLSQVITIRPAEVKKDIVKGKLVVIAKSLMGDWFPDLVEAMLARVASTYKGNSQYQNELIGEVAVALYPGELLQEARSVFICRVAGKVTGAANMVSISALSPAALPGRQLPLKSDIRL